MHIKTDVLDFPILHEVALVYSWLPARLGSLRCKVDPIIAWVGANYDGLVHSAAQQDLVVRLVELLRSENDPCLIKSRMPCTSIFSYTWIIMHAPVQISNCFDAWLAHYGGEPGTCSHLDARLVRNVSQLLQMRVFTSQSKLCSGQERQTVQLVTECVGKDCEPTLNPMESHHDLQNSTDTPLV